MPGVYNQELLGSEPRISGRWVQPGARTPGTLGKSFLHPRGARGNRPGLPRLAALRAHRRRRRGGLPPPARASCARTCRTRCRASTKPSAFMPTGALCPCTSSAIAKPTATAVARLPRSGLPLRSGTRSRKGKVAPLPAEGKRREGATSSEGEIGWGKAASVRRGLKARDRCPAGSGGVAVVRGGPALGTGSCPSKDQVATPPSEGVGPRPLASVGPPLRRRCGRVVPAVWFCNLTEEKRGRNSSNTHPSCRGALTAPSLSNGGVVVCCID